jgi:hypothetical protein
VNRSGEINQRSRKTLAAAGRPLVNPHRACKMNDSSPIDTRTCVNFSSERRAGVDPRLDPRSDNGSDH